MESPRKFHDCYFYYYSTCTKGDSCVFRHEPAALGCETMCTAWQEGKCVDKKCRLRHMELRKNRKQILCYWETQPGGCRKKHCPFMHKNPEARTDGIPPSNPIPGAPATMPSTSAPEHLEPMPAVLSVVPGLPSGIPQAPGAPMPLRWPQPTVMPDAALLGARQAAHMRPLRPLLRPRHADPLVVHFEEESDSDTPASTPGTAPLDQEMLMLHRIQAAAAALYSYEEPQPKYDQSLDELAGKKAKDNTLDFKVMSLDEIRATKEGRKRKVSCHETVVDSTNKIVKLVRSNSIVYKKVDNPPQAVSVKVDKRQQDVEGDRQRTFSTQSETDDELVDQSHEFDDHDDFDAIEAPKLYISNNITKKPRVGSDRDEICVNDDSEVTIVGETFCSKPVTVGEVIDLDENNGDDPVHVVDLSDDEITASDLDLELVKVVPDVVASCTKSRSRRSDIDTMLNDDL